MVDKVTTNCHIVYTIRRSKGVSVCSEAPHVIFQHVIFFMFSEKRQRYIITIVVLFPVVDVLSLAIRCEGQRDFKGPEGADM